MSPAKQSYKTLSELPRKAACWGSGHSRGGSKELGAAGYPEVFAAPCCGKTHRQREAVPLPPRCARDAGRGLRVREERHSPSLHPAHPPARHGCQRRKGEGAALKKPFCSFSFCKTCVQAALAAHSSGLFGKGGAASRAVFLLGTTASSTRSGTKTKPRERLAGEGKNYPI